MGSEWKTIPLEEGMEAIIDYRGKTPNKTTSGIPLITAKIIKAGQILPVQEFIAEDDYDDWMRRGLPKPGDIVMTTEAPLGEVAQLDNRKIALAQRLITLRGKKGVLDNTFLKYLMQSSNVQEQLTARSTGTTVVGIKQRELRKVMLFVPPFPEQRAIAHILGTLDDKIELNRKMNETLEAIARAIFKSWFVDFDPVRAKAEGRVPALPKESADLFPDSFEDSELGEIPKGWEIKRFSNTIEIIGGGTPKTSVPDYWGGDIPWFSVGDAPHDTDVWVVETQKKITQAGIDNSSTRVLPEGTTIISARGTVGRLALVGVPMAMNQSCYGLRGTYDKRGFFTYYTTRSLVDTLQHRTHGSVFGTITRDTLEGVEVVVPQPRVIYVFEQTVAPLLEHIRKNLIESHTLAAIRDALLPKLLTEKIKIKDAEKFVR